MTSLPSAGSRQPPGRPVQRFFRTFRVLPAEGWTGAATAGGVAAAIEGWTAPAEGVGLGVALDVDGFGTATDGTGD